MDRAALSTERAVADPLAERGCGMGTFGVVA